MGFILMSFIIILLLSWLINGIIKFIINFVRFRNEALKLVGYGGFPSTHTSIISSMFFYIGFTEGFNNIVLAPLIVIFWLVINDALFLRIQIGKHAKSLNKLVQRNDHRERIGHNLYEIIGGILTGLLVPYFFIKFVEL